MIPNEKKRRMALSCSKKLSTLLRGTSWGIFMAWIVFILLEHQVKSHEKYVKIKIFVELQCHQKRIIY